MQLHNVTMKGLVSSEIVVLHQSVEVKDENLESNKLTKGQITTVSVSHLSFTVRVKHSIFSIPFYLHHTEHSHKI